jgi:hypothetical protein
MGAYTWLPWARVLVDQVQRWSILRIAISATKYDRSLLLLGIHGSDGGDEFRDQMSELVGAGAAEVIFQVPLSGRSSWTVISL